MIKLHDLKSWPDYFVSVMDKERRFEVRRDDRDFEAGDFLLLREFDADQLDGAGLYTGRELLCRVNYVMDGEPAPGFSLLGFVIMDIDLQEVVEENYSDAYLEVLPPEPEDEPEPAITR